MSSENGTDYGLNDSKMVMQKDFFTISLGIVLTTVNIFALGVLASCKKMMVQIRLMAINLSCTCLLYTSPSPRDLSTSRMPSSA